MYDKALYYGYSAELIKKLKISRKELKASVSMDEKYSSIILEADKSFAEGKLERAKELYNTAMLYNSKSEYPLQRLNSVDSIYSSKALSMWNNYRTHISIADSLFAQLNYPKAKENYELSLGYRPNDVYAFQKIQIIDSIIDATRREEQLARKKAERKAKEIQDRERSDEKEKLQLKEAKEKTNEINSNTIEEKQKENKNYRQLIRTADQFFADQNYVEAKTFYQKAIRINSFDDYAKLRIKAIDSLSARNLTERIVLEDNELKNTDTLFFLDTVESEIRVREILIELNSESLLSNPGKQASLFNEMGNIYQNEYNLNEAIKYYEQSKQAFQKSGDKKGELAAINNIATAYYDSGRYDKSLEQYRSSLKLAHKLNDIETVASIQFNIASVYKTTYQFDDAIDYFEKSIDSKKQTGELEELNSIYKTLGNTYYEKSDFKNAIKQYEKSLDLEIQHQNKAEMASTMNNLGVAHYNDGNFEKALEYYQQSLQETRVSKNDKERAITLNNIGNINFDWKKYAEAISYYEQSIELKQSLNFKEGIAVSLHNIGNAVAELNRTNDAIEHYNSSLEIAKEVNYTEVIYRNYKAFANLYEGAGNYKKALEYYKLFSKFQIRNIGNKIQISEIKEQYETTKRVVKSLKRELRRHKLIARYEAERASDEIRIRDLEIKSRTEQLARQRLLIFTFIAGFVVILFFSLLITRQYQQKNKAFELIAAQKVQITDSIAYASKIQRAVLPPDKVISGLIPQYFILNMPRDVVGGDFFWITKKSAKTVIAIADCTGHGVPGGFMSMLGVSILNEIISRDEVNLPHEILNLLRSRLIDALHQKSRNAEAMDGMDISLAIIDFKENTLEFSGAYNSMYLVRDKELLMLKADKIPVGLRKLHKSFETQNIKLFKNDMLYLTTDGYADQLGHETKKRFLLSRFKGTLIEVHNKPVMEQEQEMKKTIKEWQGNLDQTDDILVMGIKI
jgi:tetratricopeptide (TPR) repeat protein